jgi:RsiW-degrading membrane proteinase PrsW (M82 family)
MKILWLKNTVPTIYFGAGIVGFPMVWQWIRDKSYTPTTVWIEVVIGSFIFGAALAFVMCLTASLLRTFAVHLMSKWRTLR